MIVCERKQPIFRNFLCILVLGLFAAACSPQQSTTSVAPSVTSSPGVGDVGNRLNAARVQRGLGQLSRSDALERAALAHANDMSRKGYFSHTSQNGDTLVDRVKAVGYSYCFVAENIAQGQRSSADVMNAWMNSPGHRRNNLSDRATEYGIARAAGDYWVLVLGSRC